MPLRLRLVRLASAAAAAALALAVGAAPTWAADPEAVSVVYHVPFGANVEVTVSQGWHDAYSHVGLAEYAYDLVAPEGTPVLAAADGRVAFTHAGDGSCGGPDLLGDANVVTIDHADGAATHYGHLLDLAVVAGQTVVAGQVIGHLGRTGYTSCNPHLHFARQAGGGAVTQSIPIEFAEYPGRRFAAGDVLVGGLVMTAGAQAVRVEPMTEVELRTDVELRQSIRTRVETLRSLGAVSGPWLPPAADDAELPFRIARQLNQP